MKIFSVTIEHEKRLDDLVVFEFLTVNANG